MRATLLICALMSAGLLSGPADARPRDREQRQQQQQQQRVEQRRESRREERRDERREEPREAPRQESPLLAPNGWRDAPPAFDRSDAARRAQRRNGGGRVLSVDPEGSGYRVKVLKDGEVRTHHVDDDGN